MSSKHEEFLYRVKLSFSAGCSSRLVNKRRETGISIVVKTINMEPLTAGYLLAATMAGAAYLDGKLGISLDVRELHRERTWRRRLEERIKSLGTQCTLYGVLSGADRNAQALWFEGRTWTYTDLKSIVDKLAEICHGRGIEQGDVVAVFATNSPEMVATCLALSKLGAVAALINTNLREETLQHCVNIAQAKYIISTPDLASFVTLDLPHLSLNLFSFDHVNMAETQLDGLLTSASKEWSQAVPFTPAVPQSLVDVTMLIYTSGTTGKPKACAIRNMQIIATSTPLSVDVRDPKRYYPLRTYSALPLFHGTAFFAGFSYVLGCTGALCLRRKFSATHFWEDVAKSKATRILYVGELCRYLLGTPPSSYDLHHNCIVAQGNGLRGDIWHTFKERFGVPEFREFYRSTEGLAKFENFSMGDTGAGKIGFVGPLRRVLEDDTFIIRIDKVTKKPIRDAKTHFCIRAGLGEAGEAIGRCRNHKLLTEYFGNRVATQEKLISNVFRKGDLFQRMGDLIVHENSGWVRFGDRMGDTYRWKGENVSAGEVRDFICRIAEVHDAIVYGVKLERYTNKPLPESSHHMLTANGRYDGQAGGITVSLKPDSSPSEGRFIEKLYSELVKHGLPKYALPRLVRIVDQVQTNDTFKQAKKEIIEKSWSPSVDQGGDRLYWLDRTKYRRLRTQDWTRIEIGTAHL
jgi:acyl-CoA synthetase (AMP-forming)/AMP-acid ligase II